MITAQQFVKARDEIEGNEYRERYMEEPKLVANDLEELRQEEKKRSPLTPYMRDNLNIPDILNVRFAEPLSTFASEYSHSEFHQRSYDKLKQQFSHWRKIRGDGNCFYRAFAFAYLEHLILRKDK